MTEEMELLVKEVHAAPLELCGVDRKMELLIREVNAATCHLIDLLPMYDRRLHGPISRIQRAAAYLMWFVIVQECKGGAS
ncbi:MAG: hypothetical protein HGB04_01695 [Chlorobiaceae bacterium]|nr:hypothetical protein [Chlorobiaceae bacterium]